ncbi:MAG: hypothetical protein JO280_01110 [Mycobacteriaceae bacterium]|nr:hypothetical protein [Mycobacteriaceae bacterium]
MNFVVLASALSSCNAGLYSNGRLLKKLASDGAAPKIFDNTSHAHVPGVSSSPATWSTAAGSRGGWRPRVRSSCPSPANCVGPHWCS